MIEIAAALFLLGWLMAAIGTWVGLFGPGKEDLGVAWLLLYLFLTILIWPELLAFHVARHVRNDNHRI